MNMLNGALAKSYIWWDSANGLDAALCLADVGNSIGPL